MEIQQTRSSIISNLTPTHPSSYRYCYSLRQMAISTIILLAPLLVVVGCLFVSVEGFVSPVCVVNRYEMSIEDCRRFRLAGKDPDKQEDFDAELVQQQIDKMMIDSESKDALFGSASKEMEEDISPVPMFTGLVVLFGTTVLTLYGFYVFFTGSDPAHDAGLI